MPFFEIFFSSGPGKLPSDDFLHPPLALAPLRRCPPVSGSHQCSNPPEEQAQYFAGGNLFTVYERRRGEA